MRIPPSFFIIGERKCATSSLYRYLIEHPQVLPCRVKEPQFFSKPWWYRALFTSRYRAMFPRESDTQVALDWLDLSEDGKIVQEKLIFYRDPKLKVITGEASATTFAQVPPERLKRAYPGAKLILCLRHPVDRAYSHYCMLKRFAEEGRRIPIRLSDFATDFEEDLARTRDGGDGYFAGLSFYAERFKRWNAVFDKDLFYLVRAEDLADKQSEQKALTELCRFLDINDNDFTSLLGMMVNRSGSGKGLDPALRRELWEYYAKDVDALEQYTGRSFNWNP